jgi:hypothetical protein
MITIDGQDLGDRVRVVYKWNKIEESFKNVAVTEIAQANGIAVPVNRNYNSYMIDE